MLVLVWFLSQTDSFCPYVCVFSSVFSGLLWPSGPTGRSLRALSGTWALGPPTTHSPPTQWWTPWGATQALVTKDPLCLRWGQKNYIKLLRSWLKRIRPESHSRRSPTGNTIRFSARSRPWLPADEGCSDTHSGRKRTGTGQRVRIMIILIQSPCSLFILSSSYIQGETQLLHTLSKNKVNNNNYNIMLFLLLKNFNIKLFLPPQKEGNSSVSVCWLVSWFVSRHTKTTINSNKCCIFKLHVFPHLYLMTWGQIYAKLVLYNLYKFTLLDTSRGMCDCRVCCVRGETLFNFWL